MTKNANFVSHKKSKLKNQDGSPQLPSASALVEGEIAINFAENVETLSIKNESGDVVTFSSDNYYSEKKLGSAFTGSNSAVTVTDVIEENEEIIAAALTDLDERKLDASAYTPIDLSNYYTKSETSGATELTNALNLKANASDFNTHTGNTSIHHTHDNKNILDAITSSVGTMAYQNTNSYSSATEVNTALGNKANTATTLAGYGITDAYTKSETSGASEISTALGDKVNIATTVSTASGLTGGGDLSVNRTLGLAAVTVAGYTGGGVTSNTVSYDAYGRISSAASIIYSAVTVSSSLTNITCPSDITGTSKSGSQAIVIYHNGGSTTDYDISISTTNIISPSGEQVNLICPKNGYCEINFLNIGGTIFVRGV